MVEIERGGSILGWYEEEGWGGEVVVEVVLGGLEKGGWDCGVVGERLKSYI